MTKSEIIRDLLKNRTIVFLTSWTTKSDWTMYYGWNLLKPFEYNKNISQLQRTFSLEQGICYLFIFVNDIESSCEDLGEISIDETKTPCRIFLLKSVIHDKISLCLYSVNEFQTDNVSNIITSVHETYGNLQQTIVLTERIYENVYEKVEKWKKNTPIPICALIRDTVSRADDAGMEGDSTKQFLDKWEDHGIRAFGYRNFNYDLIYNSLMTIELNLNDLFDEIKYCTRSFRDLFPVLVPYESISKNLNFSKYNNVSDLIIVEIEKGLIEEGCDYKKMIDIVVPEWRQWLSGKLEELIIKRDSTLIRKFVYEDFLNMVEKEANMMLNENYN